MLGQLLSRSSSSFRLLIEIYFRVRNLVRAFDSIRHSCVYSGVFINTQYASRHRVKHEKTKIDKHKINGFVFWQWSLDVDVLLFESLSPIELSTISHRVWIWTNKYETEWPISQVPNMSRWNLWHPHDARITNWINYEMPKCSREAIKMGDDDVLPLALIHATHYYYHLFDSMTN